MEAAIRALFLLRLSDNAVPKERTFQMYDPYKVLGISREAGDNEVKKAYRELARKYHPDNYINSPMSDLAEEKMKAINEAYDAIQKSRTTPTKKRDMGYEGSYDPRSTYDRVRHLINAGGFERADTMLEIFALSDRGAEWNFLKGCILLKRGFYYDAQKYFETACYLDPKNSEYRTALNGIRYARTSQQEQRTRKKKVKKKGLFSKLKEFILRFFGGKKFRYF
jgi:curved DNA-binding protein CbpA